MLNKLSIICLKQFLLQVWILSKFQFEPIKHHLIFDQVPVLSNGIISGVAQFKCIEGCLCVCYFIFIGFSFELLGLEIVLICLIDFSMLLKRRFKQVTEVSILFIFLIKFNGILIVLLGLHQDKNYNYQILKIQLFQFITSQLKIETIKLTAYNYKQYNNIIQCNVLQCIVFQYNTMQCNTLQYRQVTYKNINKIINMMQLMQPNSRYKMLITTITWMKDSHLLFDYQFDKNIVKQQLTISLQPSFVFIFRNNQKSEVKFIKTSKMTVPKIQAHQLLGCFQIVLNIAPNKQKKFKLNFYDADTFELANGKDERVGTQVSNNSGDFRKEGIFFIVRSLKDHDHESKGFQLKSGQKIKFGRIQYNVTVVKQGDDENQNYFEYEETLTVDENKKYTEQQACKFCLINQQTQPLSFFCTPCDCFGSCSIVHYDCLLQWCKTKVKKSKIGKLTHFNFQKFECEICKKYFPRFILKGKNKYDLLPIDMPQKPYLVLSSNAHSSQRQKSMLMINYTQDGIIKVGRNQTCDLRIIDISVSRQHASIQTRNGQFYLFDNKSKFGTIVSEPNFSLQLEIIKRGIQIGRSVITFRMAERQFDRSKP